MALHNVLRRTFTPGKQAIKDLWKYADKFGRSTDARTKRLGLQCKTQALIFTDRAGTPQYLAHSRPEYGRR